MIAFPFASVEGLEGKPVPVEATPTGWRLDAPSGLVAHVKALRDARICRIAPSADRAVVQFGCGDATSLLCDALFSPSNDLALGFSAPGLQLYRDGRSGFVVATTGPMDVTAEEHYLQARVGRAPRPPLLRGQGDRTAAGWSSAAAYGPQATEAAVLAAADWISRNLLRFGCQWVEVGEGWQAAPSAGGKRRDWVQASEARYRGGMKALAAAIKERGLKPLLWCMPFGPGAPGATHSSPRLLLGESGEPQPAAGPEAAGWTAVRSIVDATSPEAGGHFRRLAHFLCQDWGFDGLKLAGLEWVVGQYERNAPALCEPGLSPQTAVRRALHLMRVGCGPAYLFHSDSARMYVAGLCQAVTTGDGGGPASPAALDALHLNRMYFSTEPGVLRMEGIPLERGRLAATYLSLTGQVVTLGDPLPDLDGDRVEILRRILPVADIHPMDLFPLGEGGAPGIVVLNVAHHWIGWWMVVALCNWGAEETAFALTPERLGLPQARRIVTDAWTGELLLEGEELPQLTVPGESVRVLSVWPYLGRPQFIGSSRHVTQGAVEVESVSWEERRLTLRGESATVRGDPYTVRVYVPEGYRVIAPEVVRRGPVVELTIAQPYDGRATWWVRFAREDE